MNKNEQACVYAALILHDEGLEITAEKLTLLIEAAGLEVEGIWPSIFAKALAGKDVGAFLMNVGSAGPAVAAAPAAKGAAPSPKKDKKEEKKEEPKEESDDDMGFGLFD